MMVKLNGNDFYKVSTQFGVTDYWHNTPHSGIDLVMSTGTKIFSPIDGIVSKVVDYGNNNIGKGLFIKTDSGESVIMGHLSDIKVKVGDTIHQGGLVALSGNTGRSSGSHLHLGLKDASGRFINPDTLTNGAGHIEKAGMFSGVDNFMDFVKEVKAEGLFHAIYGKSFFEVIKGFFAELGHDILMFVLGNGEVIFVVPAMVFMAGTWIAGRNKFTKWIIPLWIAYFFTQFFYHITK
jgi:hypothetical protein